MLRVSDILSFLDKKGYEYSFVGNNNLEISGFSNLDDINKNNIIWIKKPEKLLITHESLIDVFIVTNYDFNLNIEGITCLKTKDSKAVFFSVLAQFFSQKVLKNKIENTAVVLTNQISDDVYIGHHSFVDKEVILSEGVVIKNNVSIQGRVKIGKNSIISSGSVIGTDGFGYFKDNNGINQKVPHFGGIVIGENVEIGAGTCIERGTIGDTIIKNNVKVDTLCHIAHNCVIGNNVSITANSMIAGSAKLKDDVYVAPGALVMNQLIVGENALIGMGAVVAKDVDPNVVVAGIPARVLRERGDE